MAVAKASGQRKVIQISSCRALSRMILVCILLSPPAYAQWQIVKIADGDTPIPGVADKTFDYFGTPAISGGRVALYGRSGEFHTASQSGIFTWENGALGIVADIFTPVPQGSAPVNFTRFADPSVNGAQISFWGQNHFFPLQEGIYRKDGTILRAVADVDTLVPGGTGTFNSAFSGVQSIDSGNVAFINWAHEGVYTEIQGDLGVVANLNTQIPGGQGTFTPPSGSHAFEQLSLSGSNVAFVGRGVGQEGIYSTVGGSLRVEVDYSTALPGAEGNATLLRGPSLDGEDLAFMAFGPRQPYERGVYSKINGIIRVVADTHTQIPGQPWNFELFEVFTSLDRGNVVFWGRAAPPIPYAGIFAYYSGTLFKVIDTTETLDGKAISFLTMGPEALSGPRVAFKVTFFDYSEGIYLAVFQPLFQDGFESGDTTAWSAAN